MNKDGNDFSSASYNYYYDYSGNNAYEISSFYFVPRWKTDPKYIQYLGKILPASVFGLLIIYCLKDVDVFSGGHGIPELISISAVVLLHFWKRQMLLSIAGGTICYMLLVQFIFDI